MGSASSGKRPFASFESVDETRQTMVTAIDQLSCQTKIPPGEGGPDRAFLVLEELRKDQACDARIVRAFRIGDEVDPDLVPNPGVVGPPGELHVATPLESRPVSGPLVPEVESALVEIEGRMQGVESAPPPR